jgi:hypothetical protein
MNNRRPRWDGHMATMGAENNESIENFGEKLLQKPPL